MANRWVNERQSAMALAIVLALAAAGCNRAPTGNDTNAAADAAADATAAAHAAAADMPPDAADAAAPRLAPDGGAARVRGAAPPVASGVAFASRFAFRLPDDKVSVVQDAHVAACEHLGSRRCRVTGVHYEQPDGAPIAATTQFLLDPAIARSFARDAADAVRDNDGTLTDSSVNGDDVGTGIAASQRQSAQMGGDLARIERRLAMPGLGKDERDDLRRQAAALRGALRDAQGDRQADEARLASTPVVFTYAGRSGFGGYDSSRPFASAWAASTDSFGQAAGFMLMLLGYALPWALMLGGIVLLWRLIAARISRARQAASSAPA